MKRALAIIAVLFIAAGAFAGGGGTERAAKKYTFGYVAYQMIDVWNAYTLKGFQYAAQQKGVEVVTIDPEGNQERSLAAAEDLITRKVDAVDYYPISPELAQTVIQKFNKAKIPVVIENMMPAPGPGDPVSVVFNGYDEMGSKVAAFLCKNYRGKKIYYIEGQRGMGIVELYMEGFNKTLKELGGIEVVGSQPTNWTQDEALKVAQNVLQSGVQFGKILVMGGGGGGLPDGLELVRKGELIATTNTAPSLQGALAFKALWQKLHGKTPQKKILLPITVITKDNIDKSVPWDPDPKLIDFIGGLD
jgi:ribose transport system substrate-binding protein